MVETIGNLRHPILTVVLDTVKTLHNMLKDPQEAMQLQKLVFLTAVGGDELKFENIL